MEPTGWTALDEERCARAVASRDARFDGWFVTAVTTTRIYCRPSCPALTPKREHLRFYPTAATAQQHGFRACKRCRPDATPGSPEWNVRGDVVARCVRLIQDGVVDRDGVSGLARRVGYSERQLHRLLTAELGAGPLALARVQRAHTARLLIETTDLPLTDVAFAAGFGSVRQFNDTVREVFASTPTELRARRRRSGGPPAPGVVTVRLAARAPFHAASLLAFLGTRAIPGIEAVVDGAYVRSLDLPHGPGILTVRPANDGAGVEARFRLADWRDLTTAVQRCRRLLDLDADPVAIDAALGADEVLAPLVRAVPGRRAPGTVDGRELAIRAVLGQQVSVAAARTHAGRLVQAYGVPLPDPDGAVTHLFPRPDVLATAADEHLAMPERRRTTLRTLAARLADGAVVVDPGSDRAELAGALATVPGVGPWTASYIALRGLGDPDVFLPTDLGVQAASGRLGGPTTTRALDDRARAWRPWRSYALHHLWGSLNPIGSPGPVKEP